MKIVQVCKYFYPKISGVTVYVLSLSRELEKHGHTLTVIAYGEKAGEETIDGIKVVRVPWRGRRAIVDAIRAEKPDLVHTHGIWEHTPLAAYGATLLKIPYYVTIHGTWMFLNYAEGFDSWWKRLKYQTFYRQTVWRITLQKAAGVVVLNQYEDEDVRSLGVSGERIFRITNGTDSELFKPCKSCEFRNEAGLQDKPTVLFVGAIQEQKGIFTLLAAASELKGKKNDVQFVLCGDGPARVRAEKLVRNMGLETQVHFTGHVDRETVLRYYQSSDIFALPSLMEAFGTVFLEAMACGLPCIGTNNGGTPEIIVEGKTGYLIEPGNSKKLADRIVELCNSPKLAGDLGKNGRRRVEDCFSWPVIGNSINTMYEKQRR